MRFKILLFFFSLFLFVSCSKPNKKENWWANNGKIKVLSTLSMITDFVQEIGADQVDVLTLIKGDLDPHSYELVKGDDEKFSCADVVFYNGLGLEHGLSLRQKIEAHSHAVGVADVILRNDPEQILYADGQMDPHVWMDMTLWIQTIDPIVEHLSQIAPLQAAAFSQRAEELKAKLQIADRIVYQSLQAIPSEKRFLISSHDAFNYFTKRYLAIPDEKDWRKRCAAPEGLAPDAQLSLSDIYHVLSLIEKYHVHVLFPESNLSKEALKKILRSGQERGYQIYLSDEALYADSMGEAASYIEMISHNVRVIVKGLTKDL
jgi:manganese/zinc/iron transport system substrate-binding protein